MNKKNIKIPTYSQKNAVFCIIGFIVFQVFIVKVVLGTTGYAFKNAQNELNAKKYDSSIMHIKMAINKEPFNSKYHIKLAEVYTQLYKEANNPDYKQKALEEFKNVILLHPNISYNHFFVARHYVFLGADTEAIYSELRRSLELSDENQDELMEFAYDNIAQEYEELVKIIPRDNPVSIYKFALFLDKKGKWEEAKKEFWNAIKARPQVPKYYFNEFINNSNKRKDYANSIEVLQIYLRLYPNDISATRNLAYIYMNNGDYEKAYAVNPEDRDILEAIKKIGYNINY